MKVSLYSRALFSLLLLAGALFLPVEHNAQPRSKNDSTRRGTSKKPTTKPKLIVRATAKPPFLITLRAVDVPLVEVAARLSEQTKIPVELSPLMKIQRVTLNYKGVDLESLVRSIAPQTYIDYLVSGDPNEMQQKIVAIYLHAYNEDPPGASIATRDNFEAFIIEGSTDPDTDDEKKPAARDEEKPILEVNYDKNLLSVNARRQPLTAVLYRIADQLKVPFDMQYVSVEYVDINFKAYALQDAVRSLSPQVRLYLRTDLQGNETKPVRLVLVEPANFAS